MRPIKFRAWEKNLRAMISVDSINFEAGLINMELVWRTFEEIELMQYTGLKDKNGVEIYEGDIVDYFRRHKSIIEWRDGGFIIRREVDGAYELIQDRLAGIEVIGNIYEELLG